MKGLSRSMSVLFLVVCVLIGVSGFASLHLSQKPAYGAFALNLMERFYGHASYEVEQKLVQVTRTNQLHVEEWDFVVKSFDRDAVETYKVIFHKVNKAPTPGERDLNISVIYEPIR